MEELKHKKTAVALIAVIIYAFITLILVFHHEIWADEAQVWMLCKYISVSELFPRLINEGHPPLFYLLVFPFAKIFNNIIYMQLICWLSCVFTVFLLWRCTLFNNLTKAVITLSAPFIYFFPVIARSYSLIPLFVILLAVFHDKTQKHPFIYCTLLIMLTHTHVIMAMFTFVLFMRFFYLNIFIPFKNKQSVDKASVIALIVTSAGFAGLFVQLMGTPDSNIYLGFKSGNKLIAALRIFLGFIFNSLDAFYMRTHINYFNIWTISFCVLFTVSFLFAVFALFKNSKKLFYIFLAGGLFQFLIYIFYYNRLVLPTRIFSFYILLLFSYIVLFNRNQFKETGLFKKKKNVEIIFMIFFLTMLYNGYKSSVLDFVYDYSGSKKLAGFIKANYAKDSPYIFTDATNAVVAVNYYLDPDNNIYWTTTGKRFKYSIWTQDIIEVFDENAWGSYCRQIRKTDKKTPLFVIERYDPLGFYYGKYKDWKDFELVYITGNTLEYFENFRLFKYKY